MLLMWYSSLALLMAVAFTPGKPALQSTRSAQRASSASMRLYHHEAPKVVSPSASLALSKRKAETTPSKEIGQPLESPESEAVNETVGTFSTDEETVDQCMEPTPDGKYGRNLLGAAGDRSFDPLGLAPEAENRPSE